MRWRGRITWAAFVLSFIGTLTLLGYTMRPHPEDTSPQELYLVVQRHLSACRAADFPLAYHAATVSVQERFSLVQFEEKLRHDYLPLAAADHVEFGAIHRPRDSAVKALVDVYFISRNGEAVGWTYVVVFEDGDWKVDHGEPIPGWPGGQRLSGVRI